MLDIKIVGGQVANVVQGKLVHCDVGISDGKVRLLTGSESGMDAKKVIDASNCIVSPGFIDIHMHEEDLKLTGGKYYDISQSELLMGVTTCVGGNCGSNRNSLPEFKRWIQEKGYPVNILSFMGNNSMRQTAGADDLYKPATKAQIDRMRKLLDEGLEQGAIGLSYGLEYCPGLDRQEVMGIAADIRNREDLLISVHARYDANRALEAIAEIEDIARETRVPMQVSHLSSLCAYGNMKEGLAEIEKMIADGLNVKADAYPYGAFSCKIGSTVFDEGCFENWGKSYDSIILAEEPYKGMVCDRELFYKVRKEYPMMYVIAKVMHEEEVEEAIRRPYVMVGSDGGFNARQGHPRGAGTFPRFIRRYSLDRNVIPLLDMLQKMTLDPAQRLGLSHRKGKLQDGYDADVVIFNPQQIMDGATFDEPKLPPKGIEAVIVNGTVAVEKGTIVTESAGCFIGRGGKK